MPHVLRVVLAYQPIMSSLYATSHSAIGYERALPSSS